MSTLFLAIKSLILNLHFLCSFMIHSVNNFRHSTSLHCLKETAQFCQLYDNVFETDRKRLELRALCFRPVQLASSLPLCQESSYLTSTINILLLSRRVWRADGLRCYVYIVNYFLDLG